MSADKDFEITDGVLIKYRGDGKNAVIPHEITKIGERAFSWSYGLTAIDIPNTVGYIGNAAFDCCRELADILEKMQEMLELEQQYHLIVASIMKNN